MTLGGKKRSRGEVPSVLSKRSPASARAPGADSGSAPLQTSPSSSYPSPSIGGSQDGAGAAAAATQGTEPNKKARPDTETPGSSSALAPDSAKLAQARDSSNSKVAHFRAAGLGPSPLSAEPSPRNGAVTAGLGLGAPVAAAAALQAQHQHHQQALNPAFAAAAAAEQPADPFQAVSARLQGLAARIQSRKGVTLQETLLSKEAANGVGCGLHKLLLPSTVCLPISMDGTVDLRASLPIKAVQAWMAAPLGGRVKMALPGGPAPLTPLPVASAAPSAAAFTPPSSSSSTSIATAQPRQFVSPAAASSASSSSSSPTTAAMPVKGLEWYGVSSRGEREAEAAQTLAAARLAMQRSMGSSMNSSMGMAGAGGGAAHSAAGPGGSGSTAAGFLGAGAAALLRNSYPYGGNSAGASSSYAPAAAASSSLLAGGGGGGGGAYLKPLPPRNAAAGPMAGPGPGPLQPQQGLQQQQQQHKQMPGPGTAAGAGAGAGPGAGFGRGAGTLPYPGGSGPFPGAASAGPAGAAPVGGGRGAFPVRAASFPASGR